MNRKTDCGYHSILMILDALLEKKKWAPCSFDWAHIDLTLFISILAASIHRVHNLTLNQENGLDQRAHRMFNMLPHHGILNACRRWWRFQHPMATKPAGSMGSMAVAPVPEPVPWQNQEIYLIWRSFCKKMVPSGLLLHSHGIDGP